jgi:hypothetical protein
MAMTAQAVIVPDVRSTEGKTRRERIRRKMITKA